MSIKSNIEGSIFSALTSGGSEKSIKGKHAWNANSTYISAVSALVSKRVIL